jgi:hypothetical protein
MKRWIFALTASVVIIAVVGQIWKANLPDNALNTQEDALNKGFGVEGVMNQDYCNALLEYPNQNDSIVNDAKIIVIGKPSGKIFQEGAIFGQEVIVQKVLKGSDEIQEDGNAEAFYLLGADGFYDTYEDGKARYIGGIGLMQKSSSYLLFLEDVNYDLLLPVKGYGMLGGLFGRIKLDENGAKSTPVNKPAEELSYDEIWDYEYIADSQNVLDEVYRMKEHVLDLVREAGLTDSLF